MSVFVLIDPLNPTVNYRIFASGNIVAEIKNTAGDQAIGVQSAAAFATTRIEGTAQVDISSQTDINGNPITTSSQCSATVECTDFAGTRPAGGGQPTASPSGAEKLRSRATLNLAR